MVNCFWCYLAVACFFVLFLTKSKFLYNHSDVPKLNKLGYRASTVSSGEESIDYMKDNSVDLLILDMIMDPGIDGLETFKRILEFRPGQKAIIASGFSETDRVKEAQGLGVGEYIKKPYTLEKIGLAVRGALKKTCRKEYS